MATWVAFLGPRAAAGTSRMPTHGLDMDMQYINSRALGKRSGLHNQNAVWCGGADLPKKTHIQYSVLSAQESVFIPQCSVPSSRPNTGSIQARDRYGRRRMGQSRKTHI